MSVSNSPLFATGTGFTSRTGTFADRNPLLPTGVSVNVNPCSVSSTAPAAFCTVSVVPFVTPTALASWSNTSTTTSSAHPYVALSRCVWLCGRSCAAPLHVCVPLPSTGPANTSANGCPPASKSPSPSRSSPASSR